MSDVSNTIPELIAEARAVIAQGGTDSWEEDADVMRRLADALESATRVPAIDSAMIERFKTGWNAANNMDLFGGRVHAGLVAALDGAPEPESGKKVVIGKQDRTDEDESWTFTVWDPSEIEKARANFPRGTYEVVTVFGLPVEGESA